MEGDTSRSQLQEWLQDHGLSNLHSQLIELEVYNPDDLIPLPEQDILQLAQELDLKFGKKGRFLNAVSSLQNTKQHEHSSCQVVISPSEQQLLREISSKIDQLDDEYQETERKMKEIDEQQETIRNEICQKLREMEKLYLNELVNKAGEIRENLRVHSEDLVKARADVVQIRTTCNNMAASVPLGNRSDRMLERGRRALSNAKREAPRADALTNLSEMPELLFLRRIYPSKPIREDRLIDGEEKEDFGLVDSRICPDHVIVKLREWICSDGRERRFRLLYRASEHGFDLDKFRQRCVGKGPTITIFRVKYSRHVFGGFTSVSWRTSGGYKSDPTAFLFLWSIGSVRKFVPRSLYGERAVWHKDAVGMCFGGAIAALHRDHPKLVGSSGNKYYVAQDGGVFDNKTFMGGSRFVADEIEVYWVASHTELETYF